MYTLRLSSATLARRAPRAGRVALCCAIIATGLAGCAGGTGHTANPQSAAATAPDDGPGLSLPTQVAGLQQTDVVRRQNGNDVTAGYMLANGRDVVIATVRVRPAPSSGMVPLLGSEQAAALEASAWALDASVAQVRHYYPSAPLHNIHNIYLLRRGMLQAGRAATLRYDDFLAGKRQPIDLDIYMFCCVDSHWAYEYRIRHAAGQDVGAIEQAFMRGLAWEAGSHADATGKE